MQTVHAPSMPSKDPAKINEKNRRWYRKHREAQLARKAAYRKSHKESICVSDKRYRRKHRKEIRQRQKGRKRGPRWIKPNHRVKLLSPELRKERWRKNYLKTTYGITPEEVEAMRVEQGNRCAICQKEFSEKMPPCIDHRKGSRVRALLCNTCNLTIGHAAEEPDVLRRAADYLEKLGTEHDVRM